MQRHPSRAKALSHMNDLAAWTDALNRARRYAPFLERSLNRLPDLAEILAAGQGEAALEWARKRGEHEDADIALRRERLALATALAIGDLAGAFPLSSVVGELTNFADRALDRAIRTAIEERTGERRVDGYIALALGKQGAGELNYSSDIDPILIYARRCHGNGPPSQERARLLAISRRVGRFSTRSAPSYGAIRAISEQWRIAARSRHSFARTSLGHCTLGPAMM